jgi:hypothetical protein
MVGPNDTSVCTQCEAAYRDLSTFYGELEEKHHREVCMDVVDAVSDIRSELTALHDRIDLVSDE